MPPRSKSQRGGVFLPPGGFQHGSGSTGAAIGNWLEDQGVSAVKKYFGWGRRGKGPIGSAIGDFLGDAAGKFFGFGRKRRARSGRGPLGSLLGRTLGGLAGGPMGAALGHSVGSQLGFGARSRRR